VRQQIIRQRRIFGLPQRQEPRKPWPANEVKYLIRHYDKMSCKQISEKLGRTPFAIRSKAAILKIARFSKWDHKEIASLRRLWKKGYTAAQIAEIIGKTKNSVCYQIKRLKQDLELSGRRNPIRWSQEQTDYLRKQYPRWATSRIAQKLGRTLSSVKLKARHLGLENK
jgi:hypothetical protein